MDIEAVKRAYDVNVFGVIAMVSGVFTLFGIHTAQLHWSAKRIGVDQ